MPDGLMMMMMMMMSLWDCGGTNWVEIGPWGERALLNNEPRNDLTSEGIAATIVQSALRNQWVQIIWPLGRLIMPQDDVSRIIKIYTYLLRSKLLLNDCRVTMPCDWVWKSLRGHFAGSLRGCEGTEAELTPNRFTPKGDTLKRHKDARHP